MQDTLRQYIATSPDARELQMAFGFGYDDSQLAEHLHPTRDELDAVSTRVPIVAIHQSIAKKRRRTSRRTCCEVCLDRSNEERLSDCCFLPYFASE